MNKPGNNRKTKASAKPAARTRLRTTVPIPTSDHATPAPTISHDAIAGRAYTLFLARGGQFGDELGDWFRAEAELRREVQESSPSA